MSGYSYIFGRWSNGTTDIDVVIMREGKNLTGRRLLALVLRTIGQDVFGRSLEKSVKAIEARNNIAASMTARKRITITNSTRRKGVNCESNRRNNRITS